MTKYSLDQRCAESQKIRQKYPDRIPVIVQKVENSNIEKIDKRKYLVSYYYYSFSCFWQVAKPREWRRGLFLDITGIFIIRNHLTYMAQRAFMSTSLIMA
mgnify:CR=1 FL=1